MCAVCMCVCRSEDNARIFFKHFFPRSGQMCIIDRCAPSPNFQPELEAQAWIQKQSSSFSAFLMLFFCLEIYLFFYFMSVGVLPASMMYTTQCPWKLEKAIGFLGAGVTDL